MAQKDRTLETAIEIGKKNKQLIPEVKAWCQHIEVEQVSAGMAGAFYDLPMGFFRVTCPHGMSRSEAAHVDWVASDFIVDNCIGCPYHKQVKSPNFGVRLLQERDTAEALAAEAAARKQQLAATAYATAEAALATTEVTERSINTLILALERSEGSNPIVADSLLQAANVAPEFFSDSALRVLIDGFDGERGDACLTIIRAVGRAKGKLPTFALDEALIALKKGSDAACALLADIVQYHGTASILPYFDDILNIADYRMFRWRTPEGYHQKPLYPGTLELLRTLFKLAPKETHIAFENRLRVDSKDVKLSTAIALQELLPDFAVQVLMLVPVLLRSLELEDNLYEYSADAHVCELLSNLYVYAPDVVERDIEKYWPSASEEVRVLLYGMYAGSIRQIRKPEQDSSEDGKFSYSQQQYDLLFSRVINRLYLAVADVGLSVESRRKICDELEEVIKIAPRGSLPGLDRLLTRLGMTVREADNHAQARPEQANPVEFLEWDGMRYVYNGLVRSVESIIAHLIKADPPGSLAILQKTLSELDSQQDGSFKAALVGMLSLFVEEYELLPQIVPQLYKHLTDFESVAVRSAAVDVLGNLIYQSPGSVPDNMIELLVIYLSDSYVWIHKSALHAIQHYEFPLDERGEKAINSILKLESVYWEKQDTSFIGEIVRSLYWCFRK